MHCSIWVYLLPEERESGGAILSTHHTSENGTCFTRKLEMSKTYDYNYKQERSPRTKRRKVEEEREREVVIPSRQQLKNAKLSDLNDDEDEDL